MQRRSSKKTKLAYKTARSAILRVKRIKMMLQLDLYQQYFSVMERIKQSELGQDLFFKRPAKTIQAKLDVNNTPIRQRDPTNKENVVFPNNKSKSEWNKPNIDVPERESLSNNFLTQNSVANSKTIPKRRVSMQSRGCVNHVEVEAEFKIQIDGQNLNYCNKCAAHLASNGFKVQRINSSRSPRRIKQTGRSPYQKRKQELLTFMQSLKQLENNYLKKEEHIQKVQKSHEIEKETISNFYSSLFEYLQYIKEEHLRFLEEQGQRNTQICEIEAGEISETLQQLKGMREDIETNVDKIVEQVDAASYAECMTFYNQKKGLHEHRLEQLGNEARTANCTSAECIQQKLNQFKNFIDELTGILSSKAQSGDY